MRDKTKKKEVAGEDKHEGKEAAAVRSSQVKRNDKAYTWPAMSGKSPVYEASLRINISLYGTTRDSSHV